MAIIDELLDLERRGWRSLCDGTGSDFYGRIMTDDGLMVLAGGITMDREGVVRSLADAPPWSSFEISDERVVVFGEGGAALVYTGTAHRDGDDEPFRARMSSSYVRDGEGWKLALYQQTLAS